MNREMVTPTSQSAPQPVGKPALLAAGSRKLKPALLGALVLVVYALHQDCWNWTRVEPVFLGFVPVGLGYHAVYSMVAAVLMWLLVKLVWPSELEHLERDTGLRHAEASSGAGGSGASAAQAGEAERAPRT